MALFVHFRGEEGRSTARAWSTARAPMRTADAVDAISRVIGPHIGDTMARAATIAHCRKLGIGERVVSGAQLESLLERLGSGLNVFVGRARSSEVIAEVRRALAAREEAAG